MEIIYKISINEVKQLKNFYNKWHKDPFVIRRYEKNILKKNGKTDKSQIWETMISCLLSTQQRSGPESFVTKFITAKPFPLKYTNCLNQKDCSKYIAKIISSFKGLRRANTIGKESDHNLKWLEKEGWAILLPKFKYLDQSNSPENERVTAKLVAKHLKGFGPKQSRNLLQSLGLTKYEIPIDSRIAKWLNNFGFPVKLNATALSDKAYYEFVSDVFQALCHKADIYPCLMDAAIFTSFDKGKWNVDQVGMVV